MSRVYTYDTTLIKNSLQPQCEILAPRTTSKIAMDWTFAPKLVSSARSLCSVSDYSRVFDLALGFFLITLNTYQFVLLKMEWGTRESSQ